MKQKDTKKNLMNCYNYDKKNNIKTTKDLEYDEFFKISNQNYL